MKPFRILLLISFYILTFFSGHLFSQVLERDSLSLIDFFHSTKGLAWTNNANWMSTKPVSEWYGITVKDHRVEKISFEFGNNLKDSLPPSIGNLTGLKELNLNYNYISYLPGEIGSLKALEKLSLVNNQLQAVPSEITHLKSLKELELSGNYITSLPDSLGNLVNLGMLSVENNKISEVPPSIAGLKQIKTLVIAGNLFHQIPAVIFGINSLRVLQTGANPITQIPPEIAHMDSLAELWVNGCLLTSLPPEIGSMKSLHKLELQGNFVSVIPSSIDSLKNLEEFNFDNNSLVDLPVEIGGLKNLKILSLKNNHLESIPSSIGLLKNLAELMLQHNFITSIPPEVGNLTSLTDLYLNNNQCDSIPKEIGNLKNLTYLSLNQNTIKGTIPSSIGRMAKLKYLFLEENELNSLPDFSADTALITLTAYANNLTFEDIEPVLKLPHISFYYGPQDSVGQLTDTIIHPGEVITLSVKVGGKDNRYQWFRNGLAIAGANSDIYTLNSKDSLAGGSYNCSVTNPNVKDLTISSRTVTVYVENMTAVSGSLETPRVFELRQNYPNPFNPSTQISYSIPKEGRVELKIYSIDGKEVMTLIDEVQRAGYRTVSWNGRDSHGREVSSGMYFYKLQSGGNIKIRKMLLLK